MHFALNKSAVHWCLVITHLYEEQRSTRQLSAAADLSSRTEKFCMHFALNSAAVHWCLVNTHLYEERRSAHGYMEWHKTAVSWLCAMQQGMHFALNSVAMHLCLATLPLYAECILIVQIQQYKTAVGLCCTAAQGTKAYILA